MTLKERRREAGRLPESVLHHMMRAAAGELPYADTVFATREHGRLGRIPYQREWDAFWLKITRLPDDKFMALYRAMRVP